MGVADTVITGTAGLLARPETACHPGREAILFCDVDDMRSGSPRAWLLPKLAARRAEEWLEPRELELPLGNSAVTR